MIALAQRFLAAQIITILLLFSLPVSANSNSVSDVNVEVTGVEGELLNNVRAYLQIANLDPQRGYVNYQIRYLHRQAPKEIKKALHPYGYYNVTVDAKLQNPQPGKWLAHYDITLNEPVTVTENHWQLTGEGQTDKVLTKLLKSPPLAVGDRLIHQTYEAFKSTLLSQAIQRGYQDAQFVRSKIIVDTQQNTATVDVVFDTGPRYYFGELDVKNSHLNADLIKRYARFEPGDPFLNAELSRLQVDLSNSDYFSQVMIEGDWQNANSNHRVPITVSTKANEQTEYRYGIGYGTDTGARLTIGIDRRWVNPAGHLFRSQIQLAQYESQASAIYQIPGLKPQMDYRQYRAEIGDKQNDSLKSRLYKLSALDVFTFSQWQREYRLSVLQENFTLGEERSSSTFIVPALEWRYLSVDDRINVANGWRLALGMRGASDALLSDTDVIQGYAELKSVWSFAPRWRLLHRIEMGATYTNNFEQLPPSLRFFAGGDNSVRGYAYQQLGPEDETGAVIGGKYMTVASAEVDYQFAKNWRVALFTDVGNTMIEPNKALKQTVGFGFRWISPVGAVRLDLAQAIDEPGNPWRIHFTLGPDL